MSAIALAFAFLPRHHQSACWNVSASTLILCAVLKHRSMMGCKGHEWGRNREHVTFAHDGSKVTQCGKAHRVKIHDRNRVGLPLKTTRTCLSPVRIQMRMPALARCSIHSGTPSWSLSSIAVQPTRMRFFSMSSLTSASFSSRPVREVLAAKYLTCHLQRHAGIAKLSTPHWSLELCISVPART